MGAHNSVIPWHNLPLLFVPMVSDFAVKVYPKNIGNISSSLTILSARCRALLMGSGQGCAVCCAHQGHKRHYEFRYLAEKPWDIIKTKTTTISTNNNPPSSRRFSGGPLAGLVEINFVSFVTCFSVLTKGDTVTRSLSLSLGRHTVITVVFLLLFCCAD